MDLDVFKPILAGLVRHALTTAGGALVTDGVLQSSDVPGFIGAGMVLAGAAWSWYQKVGQAEIADLLKKMTAKSSIAAATSAAKAASAGAPKAIALFLAASLGGMLLMPGEGHAADVASATKAPALSYSYPTTKCGLYYGANTMGSTGSVENSAVGTQAVQGGIGLTLGYTCPVGPGYWFADGSADFANLNGNANGLSLTGPAMFEERFGFGAPVDLIMSLIPGLSALQNAVPSLIPLPNGVSVTTSSPYLFGSFHQDDVGIANGFSSNKEYLLSAGFGIGTKTRLSNGVVFDPFAEYILPSSAICLGPVGGNLCYHQSSQVRVGAILEF